MDFAADYYAWLQMALGAKPESGFLAGTDWLFSFFAKTPASNVPGFGDSFLRYL